jgi:hypothetical protein
MDSWMNRVATAATGAVVMLAACSLPASTASSASAASAGARPSARLARTLGAADTAKLHLVRQREEVLSEEGVATGALPGHMTAVLDVAATTVSGHCTIYTAGGSITGKGSATPSGVGRYQSFHGTLLITGGTGRYKTIRGHLALYGTFDRRTFAIVVQTTGTLSY